MVREGSLPYSQVPATCPYPEPTPPSPHNPSNFLKIHLNIFPHLRLGFPIGLFPSGFPTNTLCTPLSSPILATCPADLILLDFTTSTILGMEYRSSAPDYVTLAVYTYTYLEQDTRNRGHKISRV
jgi:hypothetical protein